MSESSFWALLRNNLPLKMYRVENRVMRGMPDVHYILNGKTGWIELKYVENWAKRGRFTSGLRSSQTFWAEQHIIEGGKSWFLFRIGRDFMILIDGQKGKRLLERPAKKDVVEMATWHKQGNMSSEDWIELANVIAC